MMERADTHSDYTSLCTISSQRWVLPHLPISQWQRLTSVLDAGLAVVNGPQSRGRNGSGFGKSRMGSGRMTGWGPLLQGRGGRAPAAAAAAAKFGRCTRFGLGALALFLLDGASSRPLAGFRVERFTLPRASGGMLQDDQESRESAGEFSSLRGSRLDGIHPLSFAYERNCLGRLPSLARLHD